MWYKEALLETPSQESEPDRQAAVRYALWKLDPAREDDRRVAADLYETLHVDRPNITFRERYRELTGQTLPEPSGILDVPEGVKRYPGTVEELLPQVEAGLAQLGD